MVYWKLKRALFLALSFLLIDSVAFSAIYVAKINGVINPPMVSYVLRVLNKAEREDSLLLIEIDTPGGLLESTRVLVKRILNSKVPVVTYVAPTGARAASAGLFVLEAGTVAAMAPGTHAGAAHPVSFGQKLGKTMQEKVTNDAVAFLKNIASQRGRYNPFLDKMVRESKSLTEKEMLKKGLIDFIAKDRSELLAKLSKRLGISKNETFILVEPNFKEKFLLVLSHPTVAYLMLVLGFYGLIFELSNPGLIFPGIVGFLMIVLGFYSLHVLPLNYAGFALIVFAFILFLLEVKVQSHGLLGFGGIASFLLGSIMLFDKVPDTMKPGGALILAVTVVTALFFLVIVAAGLKALKRPPVSGAEGLIGEVGTAKEDIPEGKVGWVFVHGEWWKAEALEDIKRGDEVEVVGVKGLRIQVRRKE